MSNTIFFCSIIDAAIPNTDLAAAWRQTKGRKRELEDEADQTTPEPNFSRSTRLNIQLATVTVSKDEPEWVCAAAYYVSTGSVNVV